MRRAGGFIGKLAIVVLVVLAILFAYDRFFRPSPGDPLATTIAALKQENKLVVFSAQIVSVVTSPDERMMGLLQSEQTAIIPGRVEYYVDMSKLGDRNFAWDADKQSLSVTLPPLMISPPNLSEEQARYYRAGLWITGDAQRELYRKNSTAALIEARKQARQTVLVDLARKAAKEAVNQNLTIPLRSAGFENITATIRFPGEG